MMDQLPSCPGSSQLSEAEYEAFARAGQNAVDEATRTLCLQYYLEYKTVLAEDNKLMLLSEDKLPIVMRCAYFISEKCQVMTNVKGEKIRGVPLSLTQTLKNFGNLDEFVFYLKEMTRKIHFEDSEAEL